MAATHLFVVVAAALVAAGGAHCPHQCSGHGICGSDDLCSCYTGFTNYDCSERSCPTGRSWFDEASATDTAHALGAECSDMGLCDRSTGLCNCRDGFTGRACERLECLNDCSGAGECLSMADTASRQDDLRLFNSYTYSLWDADMIHGCVCDPGRTGMDCSNRTCPTGDDPHTSGVDEIQTIQCTCGTGCDGSVVLSFRGRTTAPILHNAVMETADEVGGDGADTGDSVQSKLEAITTIDGVSVSVSNGGSPSDRLCQDTTPTVSITFTRQHGDLPLLTQTNTLTEDSGTPTVAIAESQTGTKEMAECSNRGICDRETGTCVCYDGYASSNGLGTNAAGNVGDCSYASSLPTVCPGDEPCSGHGTCSGASDYTCTCWDGYTGVACAERSCPVGRAWFDEATADDIAHALVECSNMGLCDRATGVCSCRDNFEGVACDRFTCPRDSNGYECSRQGRCVNMQQLAPEQTLNGVQVGDLEVQTLTCSASSGNIQFTFEGQTTTPIAHTSDASTVKANLEALSTIGLVTVTFSTGSVACDAAGIGIQVTFLTELGDLDPMSGSPDGSFSVAETVKGSRITYGTPGSDTTWDFKMMYGCKCDEVHNRNRSLTTKVTPDLSGYDCSVRRCPTGDDPQLATAGVSEVQTVACTADGGTFTLTFRDQTTSAIAYNANADAVRTALESLSTIGWITVTQGDNAVACDDDGESTVITFMSEQGDLPIVTSDSSSLTISSGSVAFSVSETTAGTKQNVECSKRGICDESTGICKCFTSYVSSDGHGAAGTRGDCGFIDHLFVES